MADPILPTVYRALVVLPNANGLPEDRYITTWAFSHAGGDVDAAAITIGGWLSEFYTSGVSGGNPLYYWIGPQVSRVAGACKVQLYDLGQAPPRTPHTFSFTMGPQGTSDGGGAPLPAEVACCLSMKTTHPGPSGKGRVYVGPFNAGALQAGDWGDSKPKPALVTAMALAAGRLLTNSEVGVFTWSVLSHKDGVAYPVNGGFIDDAWDTQRRRGIAASGRVVWPAP